MAMASETTTLIDAVFDIDQAIGSLTILLNAINDDMERLKERSIAEARMRLPVAERLVGEIKTLENVARRLEKLRRFTL
jgi:hypothetical protein